MYKLGHLETENGSKQKLVDDLFDSQATYWRDTYKEKDLFGIIYKNRQDAALNYIDGLSLQRNARVLEIGCGAGFMTVALAKRGFFVEAIDHSQAMIDLTIAHAKQEGVENRINSCKGDIHELTYENQSFNLIIALGVIPWLHNFQKALAEIARIIAPSGYVILTIDNGLRLTTLLDPLTFPGFTRIQKWGKRNLEKAGLTTSGAPQANAPPYSQHSPLKFNRYLRSVGLTIIKSKSVGFGPFTFLGRHLFAENTEIKINRKLQNYADNGYPIFRLTGSQYILLATMKRSNHR